MSPSTSSRPVKPQSKGHGGVRGDNTTARSRMFEGRFGRIFRSLPAAEWPREALFELGRKMTADPEEENGLPIAPAEKGDRIQDDEENSGIPAGYTYLGQFIDHDITFDPASSLQQRNDPDALIDFRTPALDLDSVYGRGPDDQPYMYEPDGRKFRLGRMLFENDKPSKLRDLPRTGDPGAPQRALIGDKRNDENVIVSQLHGVMLRFHNKLADKTPGASFAEIQRQVRWNYQWIVVNDFLVKICGQGTVHAILPHLKTCRPIWENEPKLHFYKYRDEAFMPIEFAAAAYRFGHSMVRPIYRLNQELKGGTPDEARRGIAGRFFIFAGVQERGLNGFDEFPKQWAIDWSLFFDINGSIKNGGTSRVQPAYKIDTALVNPLGFLPEFSMPPKPAGTPLTTQELQSSPKDAIGNPSNLAVRNLLRGMMMGLPSGQDVARAMGLTPICDDDLRIGKAVVADWKKNPSVAELANGAFARKAPLWYYVLAEAQFEWQQRAQLENSKGDKEPIHLGTVGGRIVAETLIGLLLADGHSFLRQDPNWKPDTIRSMGDLISEALS